MLISFSIVYKVHIPKILYKWWSQRWRCQKSWRGVSQLPGSSFLFEIIYHILQCIQITALCFLALGKNSVQKCIFSWNCMFLPINYPILMWYMCQIIWLIPTNLVQIWEKMNYLPGKFRHLFTKYWFNCIIPRMIL